MPLDTTPEEPPRRSALQRLGRFLRRLGAFGITLAALVALAASSVTRVEVGERALVMRLGGYSRVLEPGLHVYIPIVEKLEREPARDRRIDFGAIVGPEETADAQLHEPRMLTGDQNLVDLQFFAEYRVSDLREYRLQVLDPELVIREIVRATLREVVGRSAVDDVIGAARASIPDEVRTLASERLERYRLGIALTQVGLQSVEPPDEVKPSFDDVTSAVQDRDRLIQDAERFRAEISQRSAGEAAEIVERARAERDSSVLTAQGEADGFTSLLTEYRQAPDVTRSRLYIQTLETVLPRMEKVILEEGSGERMLPYLPLGRPAQAAAPVPPQP